MRLGAFELNEPLPELRKPRALAMLRPWVDAGSVGNLALTWFEDSLGAKELARLARPGDFFDFTRYRPTIYTKEGQRRVTIPNTYVMYGQQENGDDFIFFHLMEPHSHSETFIASVLQLLVKFGVKSYCLAGSMYDLVPHTRPLAVTGGGIGRGVERELRKLGVESSNYQGPTSITTLISQEAPAMGIETMTLIVHLPQYTQMDEDYLGTVRLIEMLNALYNLPTNDNFVRKARQQLKQINQAVDKDPQLKALVEQLENQHEVPHRKKEEDSPQLSPEVEKFLKEMERRFREK
ncbi:MAG: PAC2 family protein [Chloroflexota bacterium]